ncbi:MAG: hypothetical protein WKG01_34250 [Kofleriaceae bacterium]
MIAELLPRRGDAPPLEPRQMGRVRLFRTALKARATGYEPRPSLVRLMTTGLGSLADEADAFLLACSAPRRGTGVGKISGLSEVEAGKVAVAGVDRWVQLRGIARALEIFALVGAWKPLPLFPDEAVRLLAARRLRHWLACTDQVSYEAALATVDRDAGLPHGMPAWQHAGYEAIAYLFPDQPACFARAVDALANAPDGTTTSLLLGAVASRDDFDRIAASLGDADVDRHAIVIPRILGASGLDALVRLATRPVGPWLGVPHALTAYDSIEAALALSRFTRHRPAHPILHAYFARYPALASIALEPLRDAADQHVRRGARALLG